MGRAIETEAGDDDFDQERKGLGVRGGVDASEWDKVLWKVSRAPPIEHPTPHPLTARRRAAARSVRSHVKVVPPRLPLPMRSGSRPKCPYADVGE